MDQILLCSNQIPPVTSIHNSFIQNDMLDANGSYVKVYLYLSCAFSPEILPFPYLPWRADGKYRKGYYQALNYWEKKGAAYFAERRNNRNHYGY